MPREESEDTDITDDEFNPTSKPVSKPVSKKGKKNLRNVERTEAVQGPIVIKLLSAEIYKCP